MTSSDLVLVLNAGSSSLKYQLLQPDSGDVAAIGLAERIGETDSVLTHEQEAVNITRSVTLVDHQHALEEMLALFRECGTDLAHIGLTAVGHRVVHGGRSFHHPTVVTTEVISEIERISTLAPLHNPVNLMGVRAMCALLPDVPSVCVFDTAFFHNLPEAAATYAIDRGVAKLHAIRRYGFHGTSHQYVSEKVAEFLDRDLASINQIVMHLGNGASIAAIRGGRAVETSMGMTPTEGLVMGTRSGDLDPGVVTHLHRVAKLDVDQVDSLLNKHSGLKGLCGENDFRTLSRSMDAGDESARLAYHVYIHRLRKYIGAYMITLGRVDTLTFTAGVGENAANVRLAALADLENYGIVIDREANASTVGGPRRISAADSKIDVLVVPTNEELSIARQAAAVVREQG